MNSQLSKGYSEGYSETKGVSAANSYGSDLVKPASAFPEIMNGINNVLEINAKLFAEIESLLDNFIPIAKEVSKAPSDAPSFGNGFVGDLRARVSQMEYQSNQLQSVAIKLQSLIG